MSDLSEVLKRFSIPDLLEDQTKSEAAGDQDMTAAIVTELQRRAGDRPVQTRDLEDCGQLYKHRYLAADDSGRTITAYSGDPSTWISPLGNAFGPGTVRIATEEFTGANSPEARARARDDAEALAIGRRIVADGGGHARIPDPEMRDPSYKAALIAAGEKYWA